MKHMRSSRAVKTYGWLSFFLMSLSMIHFRFGEFQRRQIGFLFENNKKIINYLSILDVESLFMNFHFKDGAGLPYRTLHASLTVEPERTVNVFDCGVSMYGATETYGKQ